MQDDCGRWQFSCRSGDCIAIYDVCNGIPQCRDGSDEDAAACKPTAAPPPPTQHPHLRYHAPTSQVCTTTSHLSYHTPSHLRYHALSSKVPRPNISGTRYPALSSQVPRPTSWVPRPHISGTTPEINLKQNYSEKLMLNFKNINSLF